MLKGFELLWFVCTVSPVVVLAVRTRTVLHKARERERAWKIAEQYILRSTIPTVGGPPEPSRSSALGMENNVQAIAA
jgi:hypothetical protein